jgi:hypothetical protein
VLTALSALSGPILLLLLLLARLLALLLLARLLALLLLARLLALLLLLAGLLFLVHCDPPRLARRLGFGAPRPEQVITPASAHSFPQGAAGTHDGTIGATAHSPSHTTEEAMGRYLLLWLLGIPLPLLVLIWLLGGLH